MPTSNIISTPNITGNIGSCEVKQSQTMTRGGIISNEYNVVLTNSCTGEVIKDYNTTSYEGPTFFFIYVVLGVCFVGWFFNKMLS